MGRKIFYGELGEIERICFREGCYWRIDGVCGNNRDMLRYGKKCQEEDCAKCKNWREDVKWRDKKQF